MVGRLTADLQTGEWAERNADLLGLEEVDFGYRLVVAGIERYPERSVLCT